MLLHDVIEQAAAKSPDGVALWDERGAMTFRELDERTKCLADALRSSTDDGARVAVVGDNAREWIECYYAIPRSGRVLTMVNHRLAPREQLSIIEMAGADMVIGDEHATERLTTEGPGSLEVITFGTELDEFVASGAPDSAPVHPNADAPAWLIFTSGTTGRPKGVQLSHRNLLAGATTHCIARTVSDTDVYLFPFPLCHVAGYNVVAYHVQARPVVLLRRFNADDFVTAVGEHSVTCASLAPTMLHSLLGELDQSPRAELASLRTLFYGSAPIASALLARAFAALPEVGFSQGYGMTELAGNVAFLSAADHARGLAGDPQLLRSAGRSGPLVQIAIVGDDDAEVPRGMPGEVVVRGDQMHLGYWHDAAATDATKWTDPDGATWFRTGDLGTVDVNGYLTIVDRLKDVVVTGGENVSSREVEDVLHRCSGVHEVAVVGVPDEHWGEAVCAVVVPVEASALTASDVIAFARSELAGYKTPRLVVFVHELPRNLAGKVLKAELRAVVRRQLESGVAP